MKKILVSLLLLGLVGTANAAEINKIKVEGNKRVQTALVLSYIPYSEGMTYTDGVEQKVIKDIYATGLFSDVKVSWNGDNGLLTIKVEENPQINKVLFDGNSELSDKVLKKEITLNPRDIYTNAKVKDDVQKIEKMYQLRGFYKAKVFPEYIERSQNRIDLIYRIEEGGKTLIEQINFIGNTSYSDGDLKELISTRENRFWRFFNSRDTFDEQRIMFDAEQIQKHYLDRGYADFKIQEPVVELSKDGKGFVLTFTMTEGEKYTFGSIDVEYDKSYINLPAEEIKSYVTIKKNEIYSAEEIQKNVTRIADKLPEKGFAFVEVVPLMRKNPESRQISIVFKIQRGPRVYVNRINIEGNTRTKENVIRRQLRLEEGDALQSNKLTRSKDRLTYTDYFSSVQITPEATGLPDRVDLNVKVDEQSTGEFNVGAGFSTYEGLLATMDLKENNFLGGGQKVRLSFALSSKRKDYNLGISEPWFLDRELQAGFDLYSKETDYEDESSYSENVIGGSFRLGFPVDEFKRDTVRLKIENKDVFDVASDASPLIKDIKGKRTKVATANTFSIDTRDNFMLPTKGYNFAWTAEYAGFGADINYLKNSLKASYNYAISEDYIITVAGRTGYIWDIDGDMPITENFHLGGSTLRGFAPSGVGPRDGNTKDELGGKFMVGHNVELRYPIPGMKNKGVNGIAFWDGGLATSVKDPYDVVVDNKTYRQSVGLGLFWRSPLGPLRFEFGIPVVSEDEDEKELFSFSFGTRF